ncbi:MAG TPA: hypothetical protein VNA22_07290 [Pyrinomonadaceae bacterium]|nr:hypothetical protein [Pyrinomonadaceae bacterium]
MSNKTIAKFTFLVILFAVAWMLSGCTPAQPRSRYTVNASEVSADYTKPETIGRIESPEITESSGLAESLCQDDLLWTHNDSGDDAFIFAIDRKGKHLGTWRLPSARNVDWEDMSTYKDPSGTCYLYLGDIGNNKRDRATLHIYRVKEPTISPAGKNSTRKNPLQTDPADVLAYKYPDGAFDAETLLTQPQTGDIYVLTKRFEGPSRIYRIRPTFGSNAPQQAERLGEIAVPSVPNGLLTGGSIAPDGRRVVLCDYSAAYVLDLGTAATFDAIWQQKPSPIDMGDRKQGEAITFTADGNAIIATSERRNPPMIEVKRK